MVISKQRSLSAFAILLIIAGTLLAFWDILEPRGIAAGKNEPEFEFSRLEQVDPERMRMSDLTISERIDVPISSHRELLSSKIGRGSNLTVNVMYNDGTPASGTDVGVRYLNEDQRFDMQRRVASIDGLVKYSDMKAGVIVVSAVRSSVYAKARIVQNRDSIVNLLLPPGVQIIGTVENGDGLKIAGADIVYAPLAARGRDASVVTRSDGDGNFRIKACDLAGLIGARALGYAASRMQLYLHEKEATERVTIVLREFGTALRGAMVSAEGVPVAGGFVRVGKGKVDALIPTSNGMEAIPVQVRTDESGRFVAVGIPPGDHYVEAQAQGHAPWRSRVTVPSSGGEILIQLSSSCMLTGSVFLETGEPVRGAKIECGKEGELSNFRKFSDADGKFMFDSLPKGMMQLRCRHRRFGFIIKSVTLDEGKIGVVECILRKGFELHGQVLDLDELPATGALVRVSKGVSGLVSAGRSEADGSFSVSNCPNSAGLLVVASMQGREPVILDGIDLSGGDIQIQFEKRAFSAAAILGRVVDKNGEGVAKVDVFVNGRNGHSIGMARTDNNGAYEVSNLGERMIRVSTYVTNGSHVFSPWIALKDKEFNQANDLVIREVSHVTVLVSGLLPLDNNIVILDSNEYWICALAPGPEGHTGILQPGRYTAVLRGGEGVAENRKEFIALVGRSVELSMAAKTGRSVTVRILDLPVPLALEGFGVIRIMRDSVTVASSRLNWKDKKSLESEFWLTDGVYGVVFESMGEMFYSSLELTSSFADNYVCDIVVK